MAWLLMSLRRSELTRSVNQHQFEKLQISNQLRKLSSFSLAIGDGSITPSEISSLGSDLFYDSLNFMEASNMAANEVANYQVDEYGSLYENLTKEQYYNNPSIAAQAQLYFDENGQLNTSKMYEEFYQQALKEFVEKYVTPALKEKEEELELKQNELEALVESEQAELQTLKQSISSEIQNSTIKLS